MAIYLLALAEGRSWLMEADDRAQGEAFRAMLLNRGGYVLLAEADDPGQLAEGLRRGALRQAQADLAAARELGDLSENAEYQCAREEICRLEELIRATETPDWQEQSALLRERLARRSRAEETLPGQPLLGDGPLWCMVMCREYRPPKLFEFYSEPEIVGFWNEYQSVMKRIFGGELLVFGLKAADHTELAGELEKAIPEVERVFRDTDRDCGLKELRDALRDPQQARAIGAESRRQLAAIKNTRLWYEESDADREALRAVLDKPLRRTRQKAVWQPLEPARWSGALRYEKLLAPLWLSGYDYHPYSMGWRMGGGEAYRCAFWDWYEELETEQQEEFDALFPPPPLWEDMDAEDLPDWPMRYSRPGLRAAMERGLKPEFLPVFHEKDPASGVPDILSRLARHRFELEPEYGEVTFDRTADYLRFQQLMTFLDREQAESILSLLTCESEAGDLLPALLRLEQYDPKEWASRLYSAAAYGVFLACQEDAKLRQALLDTGDAVLVSVQDGDPVLGAGRIDPDSPRRPRQYVDVDDQLIVVWGKPEFWLGDNLYGFALMEARDRLRAVYGNLVLLEREPDERPNEEDED